MARRKASTKRRKTVRRKSTTRRRAPARRRKTTRRRKAAPKRRKTTRRRKAAPKRRKTTRRRKAAPKRRKTTRRRKAAPKRRKTTRRRKSPARRRKTTRRRKTSKRRRPARRRTARRRTATKRRRSTRRVKMPKMSVRGFTSFVRSHLTLQRFGAIGLGLALPQVAGGLYQRVFNMMGAPGARVSNWISTPAGSMVTGVVGSAGLLYLANKMNLISSQTAVMAAGVGTTMVVLSWLSQFNSGRLSALTPNLYSPMAGYSGASYIGAGNYGGYLGYLGDGGVDEDEPAGELFGIGQPAQVNIF